VDQKRSHLLCMSTGLKEPKFQSMLLEFSACQFKLNLANFRDMAVSPPVSDASLLWTVPLRYEKFPPLLLFYSPLFIHTGCRFKIKRKKKTMSLLLLWIRNSSCCTRCESGGILQNHAIHPHEFSALLLFFKYNSRPNMSFSEPIHHKPPKQYGCLLDSSKIRKQRVNVLWRKQNNHPHVPMESLGYKTYTVPCSLSLVTSSPPVCGSRKTAR
jgi:hypothetical protein